MPDPSGPTVLRIVAGPAPDIVTWGPWLEHISLRGDCVCGGAWIWRAEVDGRHVAEWLAKHADCAVVDVHAAVRAERAAFIEAHTQCGPECSDELHIHPGGAVVLPTELVCMLELDVSAEEAQ